MKKFFIISVVLSTMVTSLSADFFSSMFHDMKEAAKDMRGSARDTMKSVSKDSKDVTKSVSKDAKKSLKTVTDDEKIEKSK